MHTNVGLVRICETGSPEHASANWAGGNETTVPLLWKMGGKRKKFCRMEGLFCKLELLINLPTLAVMTVIARVKATTKALLR